MSKTVIHTRVLDEAEIRELIVEGMKKRGYIVKLVTLDASTRYESGEIVGVDIEADVQIAMPEVFRPVQEQWNGEK